MAALSPWLLLLRSTSFTSESVVDTVSVPAQMGRDPGTQKPRNNTAEERRYSNGSMGIQEPYSSEVGRGRGKDIL